MSLRVKVAVAMAATACAASVAIGLIGFASTRDRLVAEVDRSIENAIEVAVGVGPGRRTLPARGLLDVYSFRQLGPNGEALRGEFPRGVDVSDTATSAVNTIGVVVRETQTSRGESIRVHTYGQRAGAVQVARSLDEVDAVLDDLRRRTAFLVVLVSALAAAIGVLIARSVAAPLRRLTTAAAEVEATGRLDVALPERTKGDEVGVLGGAFAGMLGALRRSREQQRRLVEDAGHELRTPLTSLRTNLSVLRRHDRLEPEMTTAILDDLDTEVGELTDLVNELVAAASGTLAEEPAEVVDVLGVAQRVAQRVERRRQRTVVVSAATVPHPESSVPGVPATGAVVDVVAPPAALERAITNLIDNACKFDTSSGEIEVVVTASGSTPSVSVRVLDRGPGVPDSDLAHVFERFHRSDAARTQPGSGLGLSIVKEVVEGHGGQGSARHRDGGGADIGFELPVASVEAQR